MISHCPRQPDQTKDYFARDEAWAEGQEAASVSSESHGTLRQASFFYSLSPRLEDTRPFLAGDPGRGPGCSLSWLPRQCLLGLPSFLIRTLGTASNSLSLSPGSRRGQPPPVYNAHVLPATPVRPPRFSLRVVSDLAFLFPCSLATRGNPSVHYPWIRPTDFAMRAENTCLWALLRPLIHACCREQATRRSRRFVVQNRLSRWDPKFNVSTSRAGSQCAGSGGGAGGGSSLRMPREASNLWSLKIKTRSEGIRADPL